MPQLDLVTRLIHLALAVLAVAAFISGEFAGDYKRTSHLGFDVHTWVGFALSAVIAIRMAWGFAGPGVARFSSWMPYSRARFRLVIEDLRALATLKLPQRPAHEGLAGLVQAFGLLVFAWIAITGMPLFFLIEPGMRASGAARTIKELHETGQVLIPVYLALHVGAVAMHALRGHHLWRRMFFLGS
ncbi:MAG: cytochrome b/b6 domain-containing protein [Betaproteobacteria bacterium]|nr:cytochrome b/b6 domain-containing protein [Betaproteobacteria bacterium]